ncbi:leucine-rich repeat and fibronectin type-III domain-containing protein 5-like [Haliotis asinina]|uniref:leucine-rich repeat and fibronectin type-III domain-containing protein 5-like n=1 Tax=Haliotis asinina TaxID=109174 RepID=UPI0035326F69
MEVEVLVTSFLINNSRLLHHDCLPRSIPMYVQGETDSTMASDTDKLFDEFHPEVDSSTASSIYLKWTLEETAIPYVQRFQVHYQKVASTYVQYSNMLPASSTGYNIRNLVADTYYKVCVVLYRNDTTSPLRQCVDANTTSWHIPVSIGSSIGAILALSIIVLIVLLSRCPSLIRQQRQVASDSSKYDSMSSHFPEDHYEMSDTTMPGHEHEEELTSEHKVHVHVFDDGSGRDHLQERKYRPATDPLCNGNRNHVTHHSGSHRSQSQSERSSSHHHHHHRHPHLQAMRTHHHSLVLERHPIPQLTQTNSLDDQISLKDYTV